MKTPQPNDILFSITRADLQYEAKEKIGRQLTEEEILIAKKGLENALRFDFAAIYQTIF